MMVYSHCFSSTKKVITRVVEEASIYGFFPFVISISRVKENYVLYFFYQALWFILLLTGIQDNFEGDLNQSFEPLAAN